MGIFDAGSGIADTLARLIKSPGARYAVDQFKNTLPQVSGPLRVGSSGMGSRNSGNSSGSYQGIGAAVSGIAKLLGQQAGGGMTTQQNDPLMDLYEQLIGQLQEPVRMPTGIDTENLMEQVRKAINPIYDQRAEAAQGQYGRGKEDIQGMYKALSNDYKELAPQQIEQAKAAQEEIKQLYGTLRSNIEGNYSRVSQEQGDLFKQLGIEDALPEVLDQQDDAVLEASRAASENQAQQQQRYMDMGQMDSTYYREGSPNALMTGNEISTNLLADLTDYLNQVEAERSSGIQSGYLDQLGQAQNQLGQQQQTAQNEAARRQEMLWEMLQSQLQGGKQQELTPDTFMAQLPPQVQQSVAKSFTQLQRSPEAIYGKVEDKRNPVPGSFVETTPQWYMAQADEMYKRGEIDATTYQALQMFLQLNYGTK